jgi:hypothetical protein
MIPLYCGAEDDSFALNRDRQLIPGPGIPLSCLQDQSHSRELRLDLPDSCTSVAGTIPIPGGGFGQMVMEWTGKLILSL